MRGFFVVCLFLVALAASGCMTQRRAAAKINDIRERYPELFSRDTVATVTTDTVWRDTVIEVATDWESFDTVFTSILDGVAKEYEAERDKLKARVRILEDSTTKTRTVYLYVQKKPDTVEALVKVPVYTEVTKYIPQPCEVIVQKGGSGVPWWWALLSGAIGAALAYLFKGKFAAGWAAFSERFKESFWKA